MDEIAGLPGAFSELESAVGEVRRRDGRCLGSEGAAHGAWTWKDA